MLEGEAGIGKTTLWKHAVSAAEAAYRVLSSRPAEAETQISFAAVSDLLSGVVEEALSNLPSPQRRALEVALRLADPEDGAPDRAAISFAFLGAIRTLADARPLLIAIDDAQWLDPQSRELLEYAVRRLGEAPVALLLSLRRGVAAGLAVERALGDRARLLELGPLSLGAVQQLIRTKLGAGLRRPVLRRVHETSGGNPFFALELARSLDRQGTSDPGAGLILPGSLQELVAERLSALPEKTRAALEIAATLAAPTLELVEAAYEGDAHDALAAAAEAHVIERDGDRIRFTHPLLASGVTSAATPARRRQIHRRLAELVADPEARARHLALGCEHPDGEIAALLEETARAASARGAVAAATELLEHSLRLTAENDAEGWARRALAAAELYEPAGDTTRSQELASAVVDRVASGPLRAEALIIRSYWNSSAEIVDEAVAHAEGHPRLLARALYSRARAGFNRGDVRAALPDARAAVELAAELGDLILLARAGAELGLLELILGLPSARATLERARADRVRAGVTGAIYFSAETFLACERLWRDDVDGARALLEERRALALEDDDVDALGGVLMRLVEVEWRAGNWRTAASYAQQNVELAEQRGNYQRAAVLYAQALVAAHLGELDAAESEAREALRIAESTGNNIYLVNSRCLLAFIAASRGDQVGVLEWIGDLPERLSELGYDHPGLTFCCVSASPEVEALVALGDHERAESRIAELERSGRRLDLAGTLGYAYRGRGLLAAAGGDLDGATHWLARALAEHERIPVPFERARTMLMYGSTLRRAKQKRAGREMLESALVLFDELGAAVWAETARSELGRIPGRRSSGDELTPAEQRIADCVAEGKTNKQVAAELFVTVSTVEAALTRVYGKLGIHSRAELVRLLARTSH